MAVGSGASGALWFVVQRLSVPGWIVSCDCAARRNHRTVRRKFPFCAVRIRRQIVGVNFSLPDDEVRRHGSLDWNSGFGSFFRLERGTPCTGARPKKRLQNFRYGGRFLPTLIINPGTPLSIRSCFLSSQSSDGWRRNMVKVVAAAILTLGLVGGAMAQTGGGSGSGSGTNSGGTTNGGGNGGNTTTGTNNAGTNNAAGATTTQGSDQSGAPDKCKTGAEGDTTTADGTTTTQEAGNCPK